jgi:3-(3-hydroxy-phenyl)propionate hydroxylase
MRGRQLPVVIAGAGPTGLMCALALSRQGIPVIVLEAEHALTHDLRAGSFHPVTLDMMEPFGITAQMERQGIRVRHWQIRDRSGELVAQFDLGLLDGETRHPYRLHLEQHRLTPIQLDLIRQQSQAEVRFGHAVTGLEVQEDRVLVHISSDEGPATIEASWVVGADGGRSTVRKSLGIEFEGFTWPEQFLVVSTPYDFAQHGFAMNVYVADPTEWVALFKMPDAGPPGLWRIVFPTPDRDDAATLTSENVERKMQGFIERRAPYDVRYKSVYRVHQRVCKTFRSGRVLLAGDAAHVNNPLGAFGLNSGIHDAISLAEKLGRVWRGQAEDALLDLYVRQRRMAAVEQVERMSIRNKRQLEERDPDVQRRRLQELMAIANDPGRARDHLLETSMITGLRQSSRIR